MSEPEKPKVEKLAPKAPVFVPIVETPVPQPRVEKEISQGLQEVVRESVLPNTACGDNIAINVLGALTLTSVLGLAATERNREK